MSAPPTYRLLPHFDCEPGGPICLGAVLLESTETKDADLNQPVPEATVPPDPDTVTPTTQPYDPANDDEAKGWYYADNLRDGGGGGIFAEIPGIAVLTGGFGMNKSKERGIVVRCTKLTTTFTTAADRPNSALKQEVIRKALNDIFVQSYMKKHWRAWLYLVTGIKIAENATIQYTWGKKLNVQGNIGVDGSSASVPVKLGPRANFDRAQEGRQYELRKGPFILAYRLIKLRPKRNRMGRLVRREIEDAATSCMAKTTRTWNPLSPKRPLGRSKKSLPIGMYDCQSERAHPHQLSMQLYSSFTESKAVSLSTLQGVIYL